MAVGCFKDNHQLLQNGNESMILYCPLVYIRGVTDVCQASENMGTDPKASKKNQHGITVCLHQRATLTRPPSPAAPPLCPLAPAPVQVQDVLSPAQCSVRVKES